VKRCAIYTRKSTEDGLEQEFNTLDAQRLACEEFIAGRANQGWVALPQHYDDGGFSGGTLDRPALQGLLNDIEKKLVDCVVVYRDDRLSRSVMHFSQLGFLFNRHGVEFVSISQRFDNSTSMGQLMQNMSLSIAQYERQLIGERTRDKIAASKRKGLWMGGYPPLGYDLVEQKLVINPTEAKLVHHIFTRFLSLKSCLHIAQELNEAGHHTKLHRTAKGRVIGGNLFTRAFIHRLLTSPIPRGKIRHKNQIYDGQHAAIIDETLGEAVQAIFSSRERAKQRSRIQRKSVIALLKGLIFCQPCNAAMTPVFSRGHRGVDSHRLYRYYVCNHKLRRQICEGLNVYVSSTEIEPVVIEQVRRLLRLPEITARACQLLEDQGIEAAKAIALLQDVESIWENLFPLEQQAVIRALIKRVEVGTQGITLRINNEGLYSLVQEGTPNTPLTPERNNWRQDRNPTLNHARQTHP
jgi:DNA invertase Pin-like site-specific DNA recombinase